ncbi:MAG TPA: polyphosphate kinase 2 family protein [Chitinophagales bacterium]|nr:polyphosphate kinase 2 family protein [Chitinophagales bacterium]
MKYINYTDKKFRVSDNKFKLADFSTRLTPASKKNKKKLKKNLENTIQQISKLQNKLFAEDRQSLLIIFQGMDSSGKDGTIKQIMKGVNPQGVLVTSFKHPSALELEHDYLWRQTIKLPEHGQIVIFNRSHYENVLISKVHPELVLAERVNGYDSLSKIDNKFWELRYIQINHFEERNIEIGTHVLKFFLHISKDEQCKRFLDRIANEDKHWKFSSSDIVERQYWSKYQDAYEQAIKNTSTKLSPWYIIPADDKLYAHTLVSKVILEKLKEMKPDFPPKTKQEKAYMQKAKVNLVKEMKH